MKTSPYLKLERRIASDERGGILQRWRFGRQLLDAKTGRKQLPHGLIDAVIKAAERAGLKLSEREIQYRLKCAEAYETEAEVRTACADLGSRDVARPRTRQAPLRAVRRRGLPPHPGHPRGPALRPLQAGPLHDPPVRRGAARHRG